MKTKAHEESFFLPEELCPLVSDKIAVVVAVAKIAPKFVRGKLQSWDDTALRMYGFDPVELSDYVWEALGEMKHWKVTKWKESRWMDRQIFTA